MQTLIVNCPKVVTCLGWRLGRLAAGTVHPTPGWAVPWRDPCVFIGVTAIVPAFATSVSERSGWTPCRVQTPPRQPGDEREASNGSS